MKTSNIILSTYIGILAIGFTAAIIKHSDALNIQTEVQQLKKIATGSFNKINLKGNLHVTLIQSQEQKVAMDEKILVSNKKPRIEVMDSTLWVDASEMEGAFTEPANLAIYTPSLVEINTEKVKTLNINQWNSASFKLDTKSTQISIKKLQTRYFELSASDESWINVDSCQIGTIALVINNAGLNIPKGLIGKATGILLPKGKFQFGCAIDSVQLGIDKYSTLNKYW